MPVPLPPLFPGNWTSASQFFRLLLERAGLSDPESQGFHDSTSAEGVSWPPPPKGATSSSHTAAKIAALRPHHPGPQQAHYPRSRNRLKAVTSLAHITEFLLDLNPGLVYVLTFFYYPDGLQTSKIKVCIKEHAVYRYTCDYFMSFLIYDSTVREDRAWIRQIGVPFPARYSLGRFLYLPEPHFPHPQNGKITVSTSQGCCEDSTR